MHKIIARVFRLNVILFFLLTGSVALNVMLARKVDRLDRAVSDAENLGLKIGTSVPALDAKELNGNGVRINYADTDRPTFIYVFTPQCGWCARNLENIKALTAGIHDRYRVIGLSLSSADLPEYLDRNQFIFPVYTEPSSESKANYKLGATPATILVSPKGTVLKIWNGMYDGDVKKDLEEYFQFRLPSTQNDVALTLVK
jgi:hypothetical protein